MEELKGEDLCGCRSTKKFLNSADTAIIYPVGIYYVNSTSCPLPWLSKVQSVKNRPPFLMFILVEVYPCSVSLVSTDSHARVFYSKEIQKGLGRKSKDH